MEIPVGVSAASCLVGGGCYCASQNPGNGMKFMDMIDSLGRRNEMDKQRTVTPYYRSDVMSKGSDEFKDTDDDNYQEFEDLNDDGSRRTSGLDRLRPSFIEDDDSAAPSRRALLNETPLLGGTKKKKKSARSSKCGF